MKMVFSKKHKEIERKYLIDLTKLPFNPECYNKKELLQSYITIKPEIRLRKISFNGNTEYIMTLKTDGNLERGEYEYILSEEEYQNLFSNVSIRTIYKSRYVINLNETIIELDIFRDHLKPLVMCEVEFESLMKANDFKPPTWFGKEVTDDPRYKNKYLALNGIPK